MKTTRTHAIPARARGVASSVAILLLVGATAPLRAQIINVPMPGEAARPVTLSASFGFLQSGDRVDGKSGTSWYLGEAIQYKAMVDLGLRAGGLGITGSLARQPLQRVGGAATPGTVGEIDLRQLMAHFRTRDPIGAGQVIEVSAGLSQWVNYSGEDTFTAEDREARNAFTLVVGYGIAFSLGDRASIVLVQELATLWGPGEGLAANQSRQVQMYTTRLGGRFRLRGGR